LLPEEQRIDGAGAFGGELVGPLRREPQEPQQLCVLISI